MLLILHILIILSLSLNACMIRNSVIPAEKENLLNLEVLGAYLVADGNLIEVRYRIKGFTGKALNPHETYIIDESTGELIHISKPPRLPAITSDRPSPANFIVFQNRGKRLKDGSLITVVIGGLRKENVRIVASGEF